MANFSHYTMQQKSHQIAVYGWDVYPAGSVLEGQSRKNFLGYFDTEDEVKQEYPQAQYSHPIFEPMNSVDHLPDDGY